MSAEDDPAAPTLRGSGLNRLRRIATSEGWEVERVWHPEALGELGADMHAEVAAQRLAAAHGLAPPVLGFDAEARRLRMPWIAGAPLEPDWPHRAVRRDAMAELLARLREVPAPGLPRLDLPHRVRQLHRRLAARDAARAAAFTADIEAAIDRWQRTLSSGGAEAAGRGEVCLVHGDLTPGNVLVRPDGSLLLLDWEYAHAGGPWDELAALCATFDAAAPGGATALADWVATVPAPDAARFGSTRQLRRLLDALWYALMAALPGGTAAAAGGS